MTKQYAGKDIINIANVEGNVVFEIKTGTQTPANSQTKPITAEQAKNINAIADAHSLLLSELSVIDKPIAPLIKHIAFKAAGVSEVKKIPADKYGDALRAMLDYIYKRSKAE